MEKSKGTQIGTQKCLLPFTNTPCSPIPKHFFCPVVAAQQNAFHGQISNPGNRPLKIQYLLLVRSCFETEKARLKIAFSLRFVFASKQKTTSAKLRRSVYFLALPSRFDQKQTASQNRQNSVTGAFHFTLILSLSSKTKPDMNRITASRFAKLRRLAKRLFLFVRLVASPDLGTLFRNFANANSAIFAIRRVAFKTQSLL